MRIDRIAISNFKRVRELSLNLGDITYLVGGNNSGKSSVLQAIHMAVSCAQISLEQQQTVVAEGREMELSTAEFKILEVLMKNPNTVMSRDQLMTLARGRDFTAFDRSIDVHISKLRSKVEADPNAPKRIKTIWGAGYMLVDSP